ncbi:nitrous oxide reductase accessory protein NosL [Shewanella glacialipiscicola]|uniref:Nitrous oxide reductase accessory protein NosL n=1 Tax=Shewanella glacialipiscicola TaxID=614069 RepID=A0ABQ6J164_9GAMM|nr:nitrous oxide reductase accessory protein NosL [Shewanella glacialipiscicola]MCL1086677.1 nitrous oxide reductase accessory protein NosL [Shewanella glacialipiscicola]GIU15307.1 nitrous oxide reductase accessory protein NosL [Shewanella glacialipiscicola]GMA80631.1 nitrous oxide reductase accessory protein NosL [Shewanella glacialipiscicola]
MKMYYALLLLIPLLLTGHKSEATEQIHQAEMIHEHDRCHLCGMVITKYPGPKGQVHLKADKMVPKFCSSRDMFNFALQSENKRQIDYMMVHDAATTNWDQPDDSAFIDAKSAFYVYGTTKKAVMGPAVAPFSTQAAAEAFAKEYGGRVLTFNDITLELLAGDK